MRAPGSSTPTASSSRAASGWDIVRSSTPISRSRRSTRIRAVGSGNASRDAIANVHPCGQGARQRGHGSSGLATRQRLDLVEHDGVGPSADPSRRVRDAVIRSRSGHGREGGPRDARVEGGHHGRPQRAAGRRRSGRTRPRRPALPDARPTRPAASTFRSRAEQSRRSPAPGRRACDRAAPLSVRGWDAARPSASRATRHRRSCSAPARAPEDPHHPPAACHRRYAHNRRCGQVSGSIGRSGGQPGGAPAAQAGRDRRCRPPAPRCPGA